MEKLFMNTIEKYRLIEKNSHVLVALSGGADSVALLSLLHSIRESYNLRITAVHINHGLRGQEADDDEAYCVALCSQLSAELVIRKVNAAGEAKKHRLTVEEAGRKLRYNIFEELADKMNADRIAVAHNKNDLAETALMNFIRGTGLKGLSSIPLKRGNIVRPLLFISRKEIEEYCAREHLDFRTDSSNKDRRYKRNRIRHELIPLLETYNPNLTGALARTARIAAEEDEFLDALAQDIFDGIAVKDKGKLSFQINELRKQPTVMRRRILRKALLMFSKDFHDVYLKHINILMELLEKGSGKEVNMPGGLKASLEFDRLCFAAGDTGGSAAVKDYVYELTFGETVFVKEAGYYVSVSRSPCLKKEGLLFSQAFSCEELPDGLQIRTRRGGDRLYLPSEKKLKDYMINKKIPRSERDGCALIASGRTVLWLIGYGISKKFAVKETDEKIIYISIWHSGEAAITKGGK